MNTLLKNELSQRVESWKPYRQLKDSLQKGQFPLSLQGAQGAFSHYLALWLSQDIKKPLFIITPTEQEAEDLVEDIEALGHHISLFPWWGTLLYQGISAQASIFGQRVKTLVEILQGQSSLVVTSLKSALFPVPSPLRLKGYLSHLRKGNNLNIQKTLEKLVSYGYLRVPRVTVPGEFALRGEVLDLYQPGDELATRVVFEFETIEEIRCFDPMTQSSKGTLDSFILHPTRELVWNDELLETVSNRLDTTEKELFQNSILQVKESGSFRGEELYYPLAEEKFSSILDYMGEDSVLYLTEWERIEGVNKGLQKEWDELQRQSLRQGLQLPSPEKIFWSFESFLGQTKRRVYLHQLSLQEYPGFTVQKLATQPSRSFFGNVNFFKEEVEKLLLEGHRIIVCAESDSQAKRIEFLLLEPRLSVIPQHLSSGFSLPELKITIIQENEIFGRRRRGSASLKNVQSEVIDSFVDLSPGDFVVHINYGVGVFKGIDRIRAVGNERDYISLEYAGEERVFIPIEQVNLIQRYIGQEGRPPKLDSLGGKSWENKKNKVKKSVEDLADRLVELYSKRQKTQGFSFPADNEWQLSFEAAFPYQETVDQYNAIEDVKKDMESPRPMDRLICGDVGYGKTEVAMRAAFKGVMGGKQVALLCPTTILAEQHYENFSERFKRFPVGIGMLSRFVSKAEQKRVLEQLEKGELDMVIGTHRLLQKDVRFKNLGLMIIDEEQRFGVKDKERLKEIKTSIDALALSATPIPRTLHMSLLKIRDMSVLKTAPHNRQPIETFIQEYSEDLIAKAITREVERGGQVFYLHNRVESLESVQIFLKRLIPDIFVEVAHGRMDGHELEGIMHRFIHGNFQVLVSTTIIENGIDIPNVNTILIDRADMYGISQLYQLRGRVGRSGKLAYAYLMYPREKAISEIAMKRLQVISDFTELGSGFKIAMKDLEVRGAGNLLGAQQSGDILSVGFDMYLRMLDEAVSARQDEKKEEAQEVFMELDYSGFIPDTYIQDPSEKMEVYKKIASVVDEGDLDRVYGEIFDRYGPLPDEVHSLLSLSEIRVICRKLKISNVRERGGFCSLEFAKMMDFPFEKAVKLIKTSGGTVKSVPERPNVLILETRKISLKEKSAFIREKLSSLL